MPKNHLKIAWRNLSHNKGFTAINISGLAVAMASVILIGIWIQNEWNSDRFLQKAFSSNLKPNHV